MDGMEPQIALLRQMYMRLDRKSRREFLASIGHKGPTEAVPDRSESIDGFLHEKCGGHITCPHCASERLVKWSVRKDGVRRYRCKACSRT